MDRSSDREPRLTADEFKDRWRESASESHIADDCADWVRNHIGLAVLCSLALGAVLTLWPSARKAALAAARQVI